MILTEKNYYSPEANREYWSASFVKAMLDCPARALAELRGGYERPVTDALLIGGYIDAYFTGATVFAEYIASHPEIINSRTGKLKAQYLAADAMIARAQSDATFSDFLRGEKQTIITGEIDGIPFKCKPDFLLRGKRIVDLKTVRNFDPVWRDGEGWQAFPDFWHWDLQLAIYQKLVGGRLPCYFACISKETPPGLKIVEVTQDDLDNAMRRLTESLPRLDAMRSGIIEPDRCGRCEYCRATDRITRPVTLGELRAEI